jgi:hypothetical protein
LTTETGNVCIGNSSQCTGHSNSIALAGTTTASNQLMVGGVNSVVASTSADLGSAALPFKDLYLSGLPKYITPRIKLLKSTQQSCGRFANVLVTWDSVEAGSSGLTLGTDSIVCNLAGLYWVSYEVGWAVNSDGDRDSWITLNSTSASSTVRRYGRQRCQAAATSTHCGGVSLILADGDVLRVYVQQASLGTLNMLQSTDNMYTCEFAAYRVSD